MRPQLLFRDGTAAPGTAAGAPADTGPRHVDQRVADSITSRVADDLGLPALIDAMAAGDPEVALIARNVLSASPPGLDHVAHRQGVLADCVREPGLPAALYDLAGRAAEAERAASRAVLFETPETALNQAVTTLAVCVGLLRELRILGERHAQHVSSTGLTQLFAMMSDQFDESYLASASAHLNELRVRGPLLVSAQLGEDGRSTTLLVRRSAPQARGLFRRGTASKLRSATYVIPRGDETGQRAVGSLRDLAIAELAGTVVTSAQRVLSFFAALRREIAFYLGCLNLRQALAERGAAVSMPAMRNASTRACTAEGLYDPSLQLRMDRPVVTNDLHADGMAVIMVTGANRGGKSTFLRSVGLAHLMAAAGMFVAATTFTTAARTGIFTHFTEYEDTTQTSGKLDEELRRMSHLADVMEPNSMLLCSESFQSTNEREGSDIARHIIDAAAAADVTVVIVTHLHELARSCYEDRDRLPALLLSAERGPGGQRSYRLGEAAPQPSSHGTDLWARART